MLLYIFVHSKENEWCLIRFSYNFYMQENIHISPNMHFYMVAYRSNRADRGFWHKRALWREKGTGMKRGHPERGDKNEGE